MLEEELEYLEKIGTEIVTIEDILKHRKGYSMYKRVSKDNLAWYKHNKEFISKMRTWLSSYETDKKYIESTIQDIQKILNTS